MRDPNEIQTLNHPDDGEEAALTLAAHRSAQHGRPFAVLTIPHFMPHEDAAADDPGIWAVVGRDGLARAEERGWYMRYEVTSHEYAEDESDNAQLTTNDLQAAWAIATPDGRVSRAAVIVNRYDLDMGDWTVAFSVPRAFRAYLAYLNGFGTGQNKAQLRISVGLVYPDADARVDPGTGEVGPWPKETAALHQYRVEESCGVVHWATAATAGEALRIVEQEERHCDGCALITIPYAADEPYTVTYTDGERPEGVLPEGAMLGYDEHDRSIVSARADAWAAYYGRPRYLGCSEDY